MAIVENARQRCWKSQIIKAILRLQCQDEHTCFVSVRSVFEYDSFSTHAAAEHQGKKCDDMFASLKDHFSNLPVGYFFSVIDWAANISL